MKADSKEMKDSKKGEILLKNILKYNKGYYLVSLLSYNKDRKKTEEGGYYINMRNS
jgi:hypothetical protein